MRPVRVLFHGQTDIYFCLALEEFLLTQAEEDIAIVWKSHSAVVCGKHQNALRETDWRYCQRNGIRVARRISGGGTVYHDKGNLCFTFIRKVEDRQQAIDFRYHTSPVVEWLKLHGIDADYSGRNDILYRGMKISGNAEHLDLRRNKVLHHGTLLFDCDLHTLGDAIRGNEGCYTDKGVRSNRSPSGVTNIRPDFTPKMQTPEAMELLVKYLSSNIPGAYMSVLSTAETEAVKALSAEKFESQDWIFGYSPAYEFSQSKAVASGELKVNLRVEKGRITRAEILLNGSDCAHAAEAIVGHYHHALPLDDLSLLLPTGIGAEDFLRCVY